MRAVAGCKLTGRERWRVPPNTPGLGAGSLSRQREDNARGHAQSAFRAHAATMQRDDVFDDGKAEAGAAIFAASPLIHPIKALKNMWQIFLRDAGAVVFHADLDVIFNDGSADADLSVDLRVFK